MMVLGMSCRYSPPTPLTIDATEADDAVDAVDMAISPRIGSPAGFWKFDEMSGDVVADSATPPTSTSAMDLRIASPTETTWVPGGLRIDGRATISSNPAPHIGQTIQSLKTVTIEAWVTPSNDTQGNGSDPNDGAPDYAGIFMASGSILSYSALLAQTGNVWMARSRTNTPPTQTERAAGFPEIQTAPTVTPNKVTHLVLVTSPTERMLYVDGQAYTSTPNGIGMLDWDPSYALRLADHSATYERSWRGTIWLLAIYDKAFSAADVMQNYQAGYDCSEC
jgi:hypothetical protein